ncbi:MAG: hypothetical protein OXH66_10100 [Gemmatimonadetes bacterium]|nr:hypothetical protein [Gemmatimonadota bacterium]
MKRFRKKPVVIEAFRLGYDQFPSGEWWGERIPREMNNQGLPPHDWGGSVWHGITIPTLEGDHTARVGDWIVKGVAGEVYPVRHDIFQQTYEEVTE